MQVDWEGAGQVPTWEPLKHMKKKDIFTVAEYACDNDLLNTQGWKWARLMAIISLDLISLSNGTNNRLDGRRRCDDDPN